MNNFPSTYASLTAPARFVLALSPRLSSDIIDVVLYIIYYSIKHITYVSYIVYTIYLKGFAICRRPLMIVLGFWMLGGWFLMVWGVQVGVLEAMLANVGFKFGVFGSS